MAKKKPLHGQRLNITQIQELQNQRGPDDSDSLNPEKEGFEIWSVAVNAMVATGLLTATGKMSVRLTRVSRQFLSLGTSIDTAK
ncbi:hypothetical protein AO242_04130 [Pseudomonas sp. ICMP 561]|nr:hypothetical protein AO242_04130 [Pseudomonas sp. ICMP 561]